MSQIQFKRGKKATWNRMNPILLSGEPGFETDTGRFKIGDGVQSWKELRYQDEFDWEEVENSSFLEFPSFGKPMTIYKDNTTGIRYIWTDKYGFKELSIPSEMQEITIIYGGNANGAT